MISSLGRYWPTAPIAVVLTLGVGSLGGLLTDLGPWYANLVQPSWKPPDWAFGPAWTTIFLLTAAALSIAWVGATSKAQRVWLVVAGVANAGFNLLWSVLFFVLQRPDWSLWEIGALWLSVLVLMLKCAEVSKAAGALVLPYLAWVTYASTINYAVVKLNGPFSG